MNAQRAGAALVAGVIAVGSIATTAEGAKPKPKTVHAKKHHKKKKHKKHHMTAPVATPLPPSPAQTANVDAIAGGVFHMVWTGQRAKGAASTMATGTFSGKAELNGSEVGEFDGPVTCMDVRGDSVGMFYPLTSSVPPGANAAIKGVFISIVTDGEGNAIKAGFTPTAMSSTDSCSPDDIPALLPATGSATVTGGG